MTKRMSFLAVLAGCSVVLMTSMGAQGGCNPAGLAPGLTGGGLNQPGDGKPSVSLSPVDQDIEDDEDALLAATTANVPEASTDNDGIHGAAMLRWTVMEGPGGLKPVSTTGATASSAAMIMTSPDGDFGNVAAFVPELDSSGSATVKVELIRPTDRTVINEFGEPSFEHEDIVVASAEAVIHINDLLRLELTPEFTKLPSGGTVQLQAKFKAEEEDESIPEGPDDEEAEAAENEEGERDIRYEWRMSGLAGAGELSSSEDSDTAVFTGFSETATFTISVKTTETFEDGSELVNGPAYAVVQVDPDLKTVNTFGYYFARDESTDPDYYNVVAWVYIPKIQGAISYRVIGQDMHDAAYYGDGWSWSFSADPASGAAIGLEESGGAYRFGLSSGSGAASGAGDVLGWMDGRFSGMKVLVTAIVQD